MKTAFIDSTVTYKVTVIPTQMRYSLKRDMFMNADMNLCEIYFEILAGKYAKMQPKIDAEGNPVLKAGKAVLEEVTLDFITPVLFDTGSKIIPFELYLLIEQYRATKNEELLETLNQALQSFAFDGSLADFKLVINNAE